jgi:hypothetical protein
MKLNTGKMKHYYYKSLEGMTAPFVSINYYAKGMQKNPERYQRVQREKKIKKFLKKCYKTSPDCQGSELLAVTAAKYYLFNDISEELKIELHNQIRRLRKPLNDNQKQELLDLTNQLSSLFNQLLTAKA